MYRRIGWVGLAILTAACGGGQTETAAIEETALMEEQPIPSSVETAGNQPSAAPGQIRRADLSAILAKGPGAVLALVETEPYRQNGQFAGFKILRFAGGPPNAVDLREGDVLQKINGLRIASPDDYFRAFQELNVASEIRFDILRDGAPLTLTYPVVE